MQQAMQRLRWQAEQRNLHRDKPLPPTNATSTLQRTSTTRRSSKPSKSSPLCSPIPTISIDDSACFPQPPEFPQQQHQHFFSSRIKASRTTKGDRRSSCSQVSAPLPLYSYVPRQSPRTQQPRRISTAALFVAVMTFLEQQEEEMHEEVARVNAEIGDLRRCVRTVRRERDFGPASRFGVAAGGGGGRNVVADESTSGSDADTEEVGVVVIAAD